MTAIGKYWIDGSPYMGANPGIDPGQTLYWNDGAPTINLYESVTSVNFKDIINVITANIKSVANVPLASIKTVSNV